MLRHVTLATTTPELLGLWITVPAVSTGWAGETAFDAPHVPPAALAEAAVWHVNLAGDLSQAAELLATGEVRLAASQPALAVVSDRLNELVRMHAGGLAFDVFDTGSALTRPEIELLAFVQEVRAGVARNGQPSVSFGRGGQLAGGWKEAAEQVQALINRLQQVVSSYAWVETHLEGQCLGWAMVGWTGTVRTVWQAGLSPAQVALHERALALALTSRQMLLRTLTLAAQGAVTVSVLLTTPGGALLALPAVWKFINQVVAVVS